MNLGDGLTFELVNGKPQLKLTNHGVERNLNKIPSRHKSQNVLNSKHRNSKEPLLEEPTHLLKKHIDIKKKATVPNTQAAKNGIHLAPSNPSPPRVRDASVKGVSRVTILPSHRPRQNATEGSSKAQESIVCLTSSQLEQILTSIQKASTGITPSQDTHSQTTTGIVDSREGTLTNDTGARDEGETSESHTVVTSSPEKTEEDQGGMNGLFTSLGEGEKDKDALEAQRTQYRKELDEQVAFKKQQRANPEVPEEGVRRPRPGAGDTERLRSAHSYSSQRDLPAAIRSAFVLGEASPVEHAFSAQKQEQQRMWLRDLNEQREKDKLRRRQERELQSQAEDHEHWTTHFDSLQKRLPTQPPLPPAPERVESGALSSLSHQRALSGALSLTWEVASTCGGDSLGRASVDTLGGLSQRARRTMTALLDPAQIEERERKRLKGLEHQRAIEIQVEERRRRREQEAAARLALEEQEGRRLELERQHLQQQHLLDEQRERHKEELQVRQTEQLYQSMQRAQEEALKEKQRVQELARKGHDASKLQRSLEEVPRGPPTRDSCSANITSPRKDIAVQTDGDSIHHPAFPVQASSDRERSVQTTDVPGEYWPLPALVERPRRDARQAQQRHQGAGKENRGGGGVAAATTTTTTTGVVDPYKAFAKTKVGAPSTQGGVQRPGWNIQRPSRRFVPASERYTLAQQQSRQESRLRRQMELKATSRTPQPSVRLQPPHPSPHTPASTPQPSNRLPSLQPLHPSQPNPTEGRTRACLPSKGESVHIDRGSSPPVPAVKLRLQAQTQQPLEVSSPPPLAEFVPYMRTDEVYHLDPLAPLSRPSTQPQQQTLTHSDLRRRGAGTTVLQSDPLQHPDLKNPAKQQAILKGLSELRQGLLQKQRELETGLDPLLKYNEGNHSAPHNT